MEANLIKIFAAAAVTVPGIIVGVAIYYADKKKGLAGSLKKEMN